MNHRNHNNSPGRCRRFAITAAIALPALAARSASAGPAAVKGGVSNASATVLSIATPPSGTQWDAYPDSVSFVEPITSGGTTYHVAVHSQSGEVDIYADANGDVGSRLRRYQTYNTWTDASTHTTREGQPFLVMLDGDDGVLRRCSIRTGGRLSGCADTRSENFVDGQVVDAFEDPTGTRALVLFPSEKKMVKYRFEEATTAVYSVTEGWDAVDHARWGTHDYRLLYKSSDAYADLGQGQAGRIRLVRINSNGSSTKVWDRYVDEGFTAVGFVPEQSNTPNPKLFMYDAASGQWEIRFVSPDGSGPIMAFEGVTGANADRVRAYAKGSNIYYIGIDEDTDTRRLSAQDLATILDEIQQGWDVPDYPGGRAPGYQLAVRQYGRKLIERASGFASMIDEREMVDGDTIDIGSISKILTTFSILRLVDNGEIELNVPFEYYLDWGTSVGGSFENAAGWNWDQVTIADLVDHTSTVAADTGICQGNEFGPPPCGTWFVGKTTNCGSGPDVPACAPRNYDNSNTNVMRLILERFMGTSSVPEFEDELNSRWLARETHIGMTCQFSTANAHNACSTLGGTGGICVPASFGDGAELWATMDAYGPSRNCSSGGWKSSSDDVARVMSAFRAWRIVGPSLVERMATQLGAWDSGTTNGKFLTKNGADPRGSSTVAALGLLGATSDGLDAALLMPARETNFTSTPVTGADTLFRSSTDAY